MSEPQRQWTTQQIVPSAIANKLLFHFSNNSIWQINKPRHIYSYDSRIINIPTAHFLPHQFCIRQAACNQPPASEPSKNRAKTRYRKYAHLMPDFLSRVTSNNASLVFPPQFFFFVFQLGSTVSVSRLMPRSGNFLIDTAIKTVMCGCEIYITRTCTIPYSNRQNQSAGLGTTVTLFLDKTHRSSFVPHDFD